MKRNLVPIQDAAAQVGKTRQTLHRWIKADVIRSWPSGPEAPKVTFVDLEEVRRVAARLMPARSVRRSAGV